MGLAEYQHISAYAKIVNFFFTADYTTGWRRCDSALLDRRKI